MSFIKASLLRNIIQTSIAFFLVYIGWKFYWFVRFYEGTSDTFVPRPQAVDAFLPINALVATKSLIVNMDLDPIHPAGLVIFISILFVSFAFRKSFCSWICPVGTMSEGIWRLGFIIFGKSFYLPKPLDIMLRSIKYILLGFFLAAILILMSSQEVYNFIRSPYVVIADVKMLKFFTNLSSAKVVTLTIFFVSTLFVRNFWCRYLCPYGALVGIIGLLSPSRITRNEKLCEKCNTCFQVCPNSIKVSEKTNIRTPECSSCLNCLNSCPQKALSYKTWGGSTVRSDRIIALFVLGVFFGLILIAQIAGYWQSAIPEEAYKELIPKAENYSHSNPY